MSFIEECGKAYAEKTTPSTALQTLIKRHSGLTCQQTAPLIFEGLKRSHQKPLRYTIVLAAFSDGSKLPPMIIFKGLKRIPKVQFPAGVVVQVTKDGSMTTELLLFWLENVWRRRIFRSPALLILDRHASHLHRDVLSAMSQQHQTKAVFVPPGMTPILQRVME